MSEVGFFSYRSDWWAPMHAVLVETPFVFWYFDMLPVKCIVEAGGHSRAVNDTGIVVIDAVQIKVRNCYAVCCACKCSCFPQSSTMKLSTTWYRVLRKVPRLYNIYNIASQLL